MYTAIEILCKRRNVTITEMCRESGASRGSLTDLKKGRTETLSSETMRKIADYFGVSIDELFGREKERVVTDDDIKFALFGGDAGITDEMYQEVKAFAEFVKNRRK